MHASTDHLTDVQDCFYTNLAINTAANFWSVDMSSTDLARFRDLIIESHDLDEITRRGFLKGMGAAAAAAATKTNPLGAKAASVPAVIRAKSESELYKKLLGAVGDEALKNFSQYALSSGSLTDAITEEEWKRLTSAIGPDTDVRDWLEQQMDDGVEEIDAIEQAIGKTKFSKITDAIEKSGFDFEDFASYVDSAVDHSSHADNGDTANDPTLDDRGNGDTVGQIAKDITGRLASQGSSPMVGSTQQEPAKLTKSDEEPSDQEPNKTLREYIDIVAKNI